MAYRIRFFFANWYLVVCSDRDASKVMCIVLSVVPTYFTMGDFMITEILGTNRNVGRICVNIVLNTLAVLINKSAGCCVHDSSLLP